MKAKIKDFFLDIVSKILPIKYMRRLIIKHDSIIIERILVRKYIKIIVKKTNPFEEIERNGRYIDFDYNYNDFSVFNMCYISDMLGKALFAVAMGCYPKFSVLDKDGENYFNTFFNQPCDYSSLELFKINISKIQKNTGNPHWNMNIKEEKAYSIIYKKFFVLKDDIEKNYQDEFELVKKSVKDGKLIGCVIRGTDYVLKKPKGHPIQPEIDDIINELSKVVGKEDYIYLATDEKKTFNLIQNKFPKQVLASDSEYYDGIYSSNNINIAEYKFDRENDKYLRGFEYFRRVYCLSKCDSYVGGESGASRVSRIINNQRYEFCKIMWLGVY